MPRRSHHGDRRVKPTENRLPGWMRNLARRVRAMIERGETVLLLINGSIQYHLKCAATKVADTIRQLSREYHTKAITIAPTTAMV